MTGVQTCALPIYQSKFITRSPGQVAAKKKAQAESFLGFLAQAKAESGKTVTTTSSEAPTK